MHCEEIGMEHLIRIHIAKIFGSPNIPRLGEPHLARVSTGILILQTLPYLRRYLGPDVTTCMQGLATCK